MEFNVNFKWYDDERIWLATFSSDKFALTLDHVSFDALIERVKIAICDIAENELGYSGEIKIKIITERIISMTSEVFA